MTMRNRSRARDAIAATVAAMVFGIAGGGSAAAQTFDIKGTDVDQGVTEFGTNNTFLSGYPVNADTVRFSNEIAIARGMTDRWQMGFKINGDKEVDGSFKFGTVGNEHIVTVRKFDKGFGFALFGGVDVAIAKEATNTASFGPLFKFGTEELSVGLNTVFSRTFGQNRTEGVDFSYAWNVKREVREGFAVGIEGYGAIANIAHSQGLDFQEHRIGPVLYFETSLGRNGSRHAPMKLGVKEPAGASGGAEEPKLAIEVGLLFGLTEGTQDRAIKLKGGVQF